LLPQVRLIRIFGVRSRSVQFIKLYLDVTQFLFRDARDFHQRIPVFELLGLVFQVAVQPAFEVLTDGVQSLAQLIALLLEFISVHDIFPFVSGSQLSHPETFVIQPPRPLA